MENKMLSKGQVVYVDLPVIEQGVQGKSRPCIVLGNSKACRYSPVVTIIPMSSELAKYKRIPNHVWISEMQKKSYALIEQIQTVPKSLIKGKPIKTLTDDEMNNVKNAILSQFGI